MEVDKILLFRPCCGTSILLKCNNQSPMPFPKTFFLSRCTFILTEFSPPQFSQICTVSAPGYDVGDPALRNVCVKCIETRRNFQAGGPSSTVPKQDENESASVWVAVYPGTVVYRWDVDERKMVEKFDAITSSIYYEGYY